MDYTYSINRNHFGYYNDNIGVDIIVQITFVYQNAEEELEKAREIVNREITNWGSCDDESSHYYYEGYLESAERELSKELFEYVIYDKVKED